MKKSILILAITTSLFTSSSAFAAKALLHHKHKEPEKLPHEGGNNFQRTYEARPDSWKKESVGVIKARKALNDAKISAQNEAGNNQKKVWRNNRGMQVTMNPEQEKARVKAQKAAEKLQRKKEKELRKKEKKANKELRVIGSTRDQS